MRGGRNKPFQCHLWKCFTQDAMSSLRSQWASYKGYRLNRSSVTEITVLLQNCHCCHLMCFKLLWMTNGCLKFLSSKYDNYLTRERNCCISCIFGCKYFHIFSTMVCVCLCKSIIGIYIVIVLKIWSIILENMYMQIERHAINTYFYYFYYSF